MSSAVVSLGNSQNRRHVIGRAELKYDYSSNVRNAWTEAEQTKQATTVRKVQVSKRKGWKTVRIFVSSTFLDFHSERECLVKVVFPQLRSWCEQRRIHLIDCDLRWGVPKDSTTETTMRMCLSEIDRCRQDNVYPFFLNMTSERCGWVPSEAEVPDGIREEYGWVFGLSVTEMEIMHSSYRSDNPNALFMLRESTFLEDIPEEHRSKFIENKLESQQKLKMLKRQLMTSFPKDRVQFYNCRYEGIDSAGMIKLTGLAEFGDKVYRFFKAKIEEQYPLEEVEMDAYSHQNEMHTAFMENRSASLIGRTDILNMVDTFVKGELKVMRAPVKDEALSCVSRQADHSTETPKPEKEDEEVLEEVLVADAPFVILGGPGLGKSSIMAKIADIYSKKAQQGLMPDVNGKPWNVFCHFVGATPGSTDAQLMLKRLLKEMKVCNDDNMPVGWEMLAQSVFSALDNDNTDPCVIVIDAVNQLDTADTQSVFAWLPQKHRPQFKIIMSMIDDSSTHKILKKREHKVVEVPVPPLDQDCRREIVTELFRKYNKILVEENMRQLLAKKSSENPLWLSVACEELRVFGQYQKIEEKIDSLEDDLLGLLGQVLRRFEVEIGGKLLVATLCLLECSRHGLLESELLQLLADEQNLFPPEYANTFKEDTLDDYGEDEIMHANDEAAAMESVQLQATSAAVGGGASSPGAAGGEGEGRLPYIKWSKVYHALRTYLRPFGESGEGRLDFYHRSLSKTVRKTYFRTAKDTDDIRMYKWWYGKLANFFEKCSNVSRKVEEYPYQLKNLGAKQRLKAALLDWDVTDRLFNEEYSTELLSYWRFAVQSFEEIKDSYKKKLQKLINSLDDSHEAREIIALRNENVGRILIQAGKYADALQLIETAMHYEKEELGARPERMATLHESLVMLWDGITKLHGYYSRDQIYEVRPLIENARAAIKIRKTLSGRPNQYKLGYDYVTLAFHMKGWTYLGGTPWLSTGAADQEAKALIKQGVKVFQDLNDTGKLAEAIMTDAVIMNSGHLQIKRYQEAEKLCSHALGEKSFLMTRICNNMGISYEESRQYDRAYDYFRKWYTTCVEVFGATHPKTKKAYDVLHEPQYLRQAQAKGFDVPEYHFEENVDDIPFAGQGARPENHNNNNDQMQQDMFSDDEEDSSSEEEEEEGEEENDDQGEEQEQEEENDDEEEEEVMGEADGEEPAVDENGEFEARGDNQQHLNELVNLDQLIIAENLAANELLPPEEADNV